MEFFQKAKDAANCKKGMFFQVDFRMMKS